MARVASSVLVGAVTRCGGGTIVVGRGGTDAAHGHESLAENPFQRSSVSEHSRGGASARADGG